MLITYYYFYLRHALELLYHDIHSKKYSKFLSFFCSLFFLHKFLIITNIQLNGRMENEKIKHYQNVLALTSIEIIRFNKSLSHA